MRSQPQFNPLTPFPKAHPVDPAMIPDSLPAFAPSTLKTLTAAATARPAKAAPSRPDSKTVTAALLDAEKTAKQQHLTYPPESLYGTWQLCFTAPQKPRLQAGQPTRQGFYIPSLATAQIGFYPDPAQPTQLTIRNQLKTGPLQITFTGPARYLGQKTLLAFDFDQLEVTLFGATAYQGGVRPSRPKGTAFAETSIAKLPFFAFFLATPEYIAARGRGGGVALWGKAEA